MFELRRPAQLAFWLLVIALLLPWAIVSWHLSANSDILWLTTELGRVLHGQSMTQAAYEPNPPLSLLTTLPPLLLSLADVPLHYAIIMWGFVAVTLSVMAQTHILRRQGVLTLPQILVCGAAFVAAETVCTSGTNLGERDHLIALALLPFVLLQLAISDGLPWPRRTGWAVFGVGALLVMLKPHYGLLPTIIIARRAWRRRSFNVVRDPDFLALAAGVVVSVAITLLFFGDWAHQILPTVMKFYTAIRDPGLTRQSLAMAGGLILLLGIIRFAPLPATQRRLAGWLAFGALVNLVPYWVQGRDYFYHLLPAIGFFAAALSLLVYPVLQKEIGAVRGAFLAAALLVGAAYAVTPLNLKHPTHAEYAVLPMTRLVATCNGRGAPCPFFIFDDGMSPVMETAYYARAPYASRFPSFWFLPVLLGTDTRRLPPADAARYFAEFSGMTAADFNRWCPQLALIGHFDINGRPFDFVRYFSADPAFSTAFAHYRLVRRIAVDRRPYDLGPSNDTDDTVTYDVYERLPG